MQESRLYWIAYRVAGILKREPAKTANKQQAEALLRTRLSALDRGEIPATGAVMWPALADLIRADYRAQGRKSLPRLEVSLKHLDAAFGPLRVQAITTERVGNYVALRLEEGAARASVNRELAALKRAFRLGHRAGKVLAIPYVALLKEDNARSGFFERAQFERLRKALPADLRPVVTAAYITGWRLTSELLTRRWEHLDLEPKPRAARGASSP